jgi:protein TonB
MLNVLLESRARTQRRSGGAMLSIALHIGIIAAAAVGTVTATPAPKLEKPKAVIIVQPVTRRARVVSEREASRAPRGPVLPADIVVRHVDVPQIVPHGLPPIDVSRGSSGDSVVISGAPSSGGLAGAVGNAFDSGTGGGSEWNASEVLMHIVTAAKPRYPESLRSAGIDGRVLVEFAVDTAGRVDLATVKILSSTHDLFSRAVRDALPAMRFRPAEVGGKHVTALAQMPFEFRIR